MILLITTNVSSAVNWWLRPTGCGINEPTREQLLDWHTEKPRKITEAVNPLVITGLAEIGAAIGLEFLSDSKNIRLLSVLLGLKGLILNIIGGSHAYDLVSEAKSKKLTDSTSTTKGSIGPVHNPEETESEIDTEGPVKLKIHSDKELTNAEVLSEILNTIERPKEEENNFNATEIAAKIQQIRNELDTDITLSPIKDMLSILRRAPISTNDKKKHQINLFNLGKELPEQILIQALSDKDESLNNWALLCLLARELTTKTENRIIETILNENPLLIKTLAIFKDLTGDDQIEISQRAAKLYKGFIVKLKTA